MPIRSTYDHVLARRAYAQLLQDHDPDKGPLMAFWGEDFFVGIGGLGLIVAAVLFFTGSGPFQSCVTNGFGAEFCGEEAKTYCRDVSDQIAGRTDACNEILGESKAVGSGGMDESLDAFADDPSYSTDAYEECIADPSMC